MFDELMPKLNELGPYKQLTSFDRGPMEFLPAYYRNWTRKCVVLSPNQTHVMGDIEGAGILNRIFVAWPKLLNPSSFRDIVLRIYWDGADEPSVNVPLGDFLVCIIASIVSILHVCLILFQVVSLVIFPCLFQRAAG